MAGPPVKTRRVAVVPTLGPRLSSVQPGRVHAGAEIAVEVTGLTQGAAFTLAREQDDPVATGDWPMTVVRPPARNVVTLALPGPALAPGRGDSTSRPRPRGSRPAATRSGSPWCRPSPARLPRSRAAATPVELVTAHAAPDVEVFRDGRRLSAGAVEFVSATAVKVTLAAGPAELVLRAGKVSGPAFLTEVGP